MLNEAQPSKVLCSVFTADLWCPKVRRPPLEEWRFLDARRGDTALDVFHALISVLKTRQLKNV